MSYEVLPVNGPGGQSFTALGPTGALEMPPTGPDTLAPIVIRVRHGWGYGTGSGPAFERSGVASHSPSTKLVVQAIAGGAGTGDRVRTILLEGTKVEVKLREGSQTRQLTSTNTYVDAWIASDGKFDHFGDVAPFDPNSTEGSIGLMDEIDAARAQHDVD